MEEEKQGTEERGKRRQVAALQMKLGFVSAIVPELSLQEVLQLAADEGFSCVELMCWPRGKAERRYAGVTHIDVDGLGRVRRRRGSWS